jgi:hypothetical protein
MFINPMEISEENNLNLNKKINTFPTRRGNNNNNSPPNRNTKESNNNFFGKFENYNNKDSLTQYGYEKVPL